MTRELAPTTLKRLRSALEEERDRITALLEEHEQERERRLSETSAERSPEPASAEAGSMAFEFEKELSIDQNASDLLPRWSTPCAGWPIEPTGLVRYAGNRSQWRGWRLFPTPRCA